MAGERGAARAAAARQYIALLRAHIDKENDVLFPLADAVVDEPLMATVRREFETVRLELGASLSIENAEAAVARLQTELGRR
jgi:hemerythrin-like domain-containing protein